MSVCPTIIVLSFLSVCLLLKTLDPVCLCLSIHLLIWWCRLAFCSTYVYPLHYPYILVNARLALCLASDGVPSLPIRVTMVALRSNSFCQTNALTQETDFQLLFYSILRSIIEIRCSVILFRRSIIIFMRSIIRCLPLLCNIMEN